MQSARSGWRNRSSSRAAGRQAEAKPLEAVVDKLWPGGELRSGKGDRTVQALGTFLALPSPASPTVLLPVRPRQVTAAVLRAHRRPRSLRQRVSQAVLVGMAGLGAASLVPRKVTVSTGAERPDESIQEHLSSILGRPLAIGVHLGPPRANRKPIVQIVDDSGHTLAFAKVGINDLTRELVRAERRALGSLECSDLSCLTVPRVLHGGRWQGNELLVLGPVETRSTAVSQPGLLQRAMVEISTSQGCTQEILVCSDHWKELRRRIESLPGPQALALLEAVVTVESASMDLMVDLGAWHGDWTPWNMALRGDHVVLWDWERFATGVPAGLDALHFELQAVIRQGRLTPRDAVWSLIDRAGDLLSPFGVGGLQTRLVTATYLLEIGARYLHDRQAESGARLGDLSGWLIPGLSAVVSGTSVEKQA